MEIHSLIDPNALRHDGTKSLTGDWDVGAFEINASTGKVRVEDNNTSEPTGESDGYVGVALIGGQSRIYFVVDGSMYYVDGTAAAVPSTGNPIGLLLVLTYA